MQLSNILQDVKYGLRIMRRSPGFTVLATLTLALGVGATTTVFSLVNGIVLQPLPFPEPDRLVRVLQSYPEKGLDTWRLSQASFALYQDHSDSFSALAAYSVTGVNLTSVEKPERLQATRVTAGFFTVLGVEPVLGRAFTPEEDAPDGSDGGTRTSVCIISDGFWKRHFGGDPRISELSLRLDDQRREIVGVMPPGFAFPTPETEVWIPLGLDPQRLFPWFLTGIGRLAPGVGSAAARAETTGLLWAAGTENPQLVSRNDPPPEGAALSTLVDPLKASIIGNSGRSLLVLQCAVLFFLLIACANIANFLLSRSFARQREIALRCALGASRPRILVQLLTESVLLSVLGSSLGVLFAVWGVRSLRWLPLEGVPRIGEVSIDTTVLMSAAVLTVATGLFFGLAPALRTYKLGLSADLAEGQRGSSTGGARRMNRALVALQLALSLVLLIGSGLMLKSFRNLLAIDPGFEPEHVLTMAVPASETKYPDSPRVIAFFDKVLSEVGSLPGIENVGLTSNLPFSGFTNSDGYLVEGHEPPEGHDAPQVQLQTVSPGFFEAMGITRLRGRDFLASDTEDSELVAIVDQTLVERYWPDGDALGRRIRTTGYPPWLTIVGVVESIKNGDLTRVAEPTMYFPQGQDPLLRMHLVVRTTGEPGKSSEAIVARILQIDPDVPVHSIATMPAVVGKTLGREKLTNILLTLFALLALLLGSIGIYGIMSIYVTSRTRELGIRMALGERPLAIASGILREGASLAILGVAVGVVVSLLLGGMISSLLFEVEASDPEVYLGLSSVLLIVALATCYLPARRAARTDPLTALRHE